MSNPYDEIDPATTPGDPANILVADKEVVIDDGTGPKTVKVPRNLPGVADDADATKHYDVSPARPFPVYGPPKILTASLSDSGAVLGPLDASGIRWVTVLLRNAGNPIFQGVINFEQSVDGINWLPLTLVRSDFQNPWGQTPGTAFDLAAHQAALATWFHAPAFGASQDDGPFSGPVSAKLVRVHVFGNLHDFMPSIPAGALDATLIGYALPAVPPLGALVYDPQTGLMRPEERLPLASDSGSRAVRVGGAVTVSGNVTATTPPTRLVVGEVLAPNGDILTVRNAGAGVDPSSSPAVIVSPVSGKRIRVLAWRVKTGGDFIGGFQDDQGNGAGGIELVGSGQVTLAQTAYPGSFEFETATDRGLNIVCSSGSAQVVVQYVEVS